MLDGHVLVLHLARLLVGGVKQPGQTLSDSHLARCHSRPADLRSSRQFGLQVGCQLVSVHSGLGQQARHEPAGLPEQGVEQVLPVDFGVTEANGLGLRVVQGFSGLGRQAVRVHR